MAGAAVRPAQVVPPLSKSDASFRFGLGYRALNGDLFGQSVLDQSGNPRGL